MQIHEGLHGLNNMWLESAQRGDDRGEAHGAIRVLSYPDDVDPRFLKNMLVVFALSQATHANGGARHQKCSGHVVHLTLRSTVAEGSGDKCDSQSVFLRFHETTVQERVDRRDLSMPVIG